MPGEAISQLTALGAAPAAGDLVPVVDVSDTTQSANGTTKKATVTNLFTSPTIADPTMTGTATIEDIDASGDAAVDGDLDLGGSATVDGAATIGGGVRSTAASDGYGYSDDAVATVTQATSPTTAVTIDAMAGRITTASGSISSGITKFTVNNSKVLSGDLIVATVSGVGAASLYVEAINVVDGQWQFVFLGNTVSTSSVITFAIFRVVTS